jgi:hypothetical protein
MKGCILFTDVKSSSKLWALYPKQMLRILNKHESIIRANVKKHKGFVVKTIGDAVMVKFDKLEQGINCAIGIQEELNNKPLKFGKSKDLLQIRIGIAYGDIQLKHVLIQNHKLKDFFGNTVNVASRMESKVSTVGGFGVFTDNNIDKKIMDLLENKCKIQNVEFKFSCKDDIKRSGRLIAANNNSLCHDVSLLHIDDGKEHSALSCELK